MADPAASSQWEVFRSAAEPHNGLQDLPKDKSSDDTRPNSAPPLPASPQWQPRPPHDGLQNLPEAPPWRHSSHQKPTFPQHQRYKLDAERERGEPIVVGPEVARAVNAALLLRRPLLVTGKPGVGKSSIVYAVAWQLRMGPVLRWPIGSRSTVKSGLYEYDAIGRLNAIQTRDPESPNHYPKLGDFLRLGPLGTALYSSSWPRALLVDEIDKGDLDLPNDLLDVLEEGRFEIPELVRASATEPRVLVREHGSDEHGSDAPVEIVKGRVMCEQFPFIVMTSNGEREFPAPFLRRCVRITIPQPDEASLSNIVKAHLSDLKAYDQAVVNEQLTRFIKDRQTHELATDQLLAAVFLMLGQLGKAEQNERDWVMNLLYKSLTPT